MKCNYKTKTFKEVWQDATAFKNAFSTSPFAYIIPTTQVDYTGVIYALLMARYANSHIANKDEEQFKNKLFSTIYQYAPTWIKSMEVQSKLRALTEDELMTGTKQINDHAFNPSTEIEGAINPDSGEILTTNEQTKTRYVKSKMDGYAILMELLRRDVTEDFIGKFKRLFVVVLIQDCCYNEEEEEEENG